MVPTETTLTPASTTRIETFVDWFIAQDFVRYDPQNDYSRYSDRADRCWKAAEDGADGSTHREIIADWRTAFRDWVRYTARRGRRHGEYPERFAAAVESHFDACEVWHKKNGSLDLEVG